MAGETKGTRDPTDREARLGQALRENLRRRKAQARGRAEAAEPDAPETSSRKTT